MLRFRRRCFPFRCQCLAFRAFRDYDGRGAAFGDLSLKVTNPDVDRTSLYASADSTHPGRIVLIVINKSEVAVEAVMTLNSGPSVKNVEAWQLIGGKGACVGPQRTITGPAVEGSALRMALPPLSVSTVVINP